MQEIGERLNPDSRIKGFLRFLSNLLTSAEQQSRKSFKQATLKTYNFFAVEQAFLPVHDKVRQKCLTRRILFACS